MNSGNIAPAFREKAKGIRRDIITMCHRAGSGHCGGSLSCVEILLVLYEQILNVRPNDPEWRQRDRFILSKGHAAPGLYAVLASKGYFPESWLGTLRQFGSQLQGHPDMRKTPGVDISTGSLGMGLSAGVGMAWSARHRNESWRVFVLCGDGELDEGQNWEAALLAAKLGLSNLYLIVDRNGVQLDGPTDEILPLGDIVGKLGSFGWETAECDGHSPENILATLHELSLRAGPKALIAHTIKGKGVSFMEGDYRWHGGRLDENQCKQAIEELQ